MVPTIVHQLNQIKTKTLSNLFLLITMSCMGQIATFYHKGHTA